MPPGAWRNFTHWPLSFAAPGVRRVLENRIRRQQISGRVAGGDMIKVQSLTKSFGPKKAVDDISFEVGKGEVLGFLGPNGAGKSTTMRMITGFYPPSSGKV